MANGQWIHTTQQVKGLSWYSQGHSFSTDMIVLDMIPYDAILGYDWLRTYSPMSCDWVAKTLQFKHNGKHIVLKGIQPADLAINNISAKQVYKFTMGNDIWAFVILDTGDSTAPPSSKSDTYSDSIQLLLTQYADVFQDPKQLPPERSYDHAIPLLPDAVLINSRPYHYSP